MDELTELLKRPQYKPEKIGDGLNEHVKRHFHCLFWASVVLCVLWLACLFLLPFLDAQWAMERQLRYATTKLMTWLTGMGGVFWLILFAEWVVNGNFYGAIIKDPRASSNFLSALVLVGGIMYALM